MIKQLKKFTIQMIAGANLATVIVMLLVGYSDHVNPTDHPLLSVVGMGFPVFLLINTGFLFFWLTFKWRMIWIPLVGYALAYVPISIYIPLHPSQDVPDDAIKLVSYNVCGYGGNYKYENGFEAVYNYLKDSQADIVCTQEDNDTWRQYVFQEYQKTFQYNDTLVLLNTPATFNALGIHTRYPILHRERIPYATTVNNGSAAWWLKIGNDTLIVINNHLESCHLTKDDRQQYQQLIKGKVKGDSITTESKLLLVKLAEANAKRAPQVRAVLRYAEEHSQYPILICGDFNDNPISYSRHAMAQLLTDCFRATASGIGLSYNQKGFYVRIDHIFCSKSITPYRCLIDDKIDASDHYPAVCWLKINAKP